jgi:hypothetical protein
MIEDLRNILFTDSRLRGKDKRLCGNDKLYSKFSLIVLLILPLLFGCSVTDNSEYDQNILAQVGNKKITVSEFIKRSEYTIRPPYCRENNPIHKKIVLNSLIGEKLLALESGNNNQLKNNADFQAYLEGRKEQAMRQIQFYEGFYQKVNLKQEEIEREYINAGRTFHVSYFTIKDKNKAEQIADILGKDKDAFAGIFKSLAGDAIVPTRDVNWHEPENNNIRNALFKNNPQKGEIIGPLEVEDRQYIFLKINGWTDRKAITDQDVQNRRQIVIERLTQEIAWEGYESYVQSLMKNKRLEFYEDTFRKIVLIIAPLYLNSTQKKQLFNSTFWQDPSQKESISKLPKNLDNITHHPFFSVDGRLWTVGRFRDYIKRHPLVFRKNVLEKKNFAEQFKLAVVDLVRDYYITQDAYAKQYDQHEIVKQEVDIWQDHLFSIYQKYKYLESYDIAGMDQLQIVSDVMTPYVSRLKKKYNDDIKINIEEFEKIELTTIDLIALRPDQPFPIVTPSFPLLTTNHRLDYGAKMQ